MIVHLAKDGRGIMRLVMQAMLVCALTAAAGCGGGGGGGADSGNGDTTPAATMTLRVTVPPNTPGGDTITLRIGMLFGADEQDIAMTKVSSGPDVWEAKVSLPEGIMLRYFYRRNQGWAAQEAAPHRPQGSFAYREFLVEHGKTRNEVIAAWDDLRPVSGPTGAVIGTVTDGTTGAGIMDLVVSAGPYRTRTRWDGTYRIYGMPAGSGSVTVSADNGEYRSRTVPVTVSASGSTTLDIAVNSSPPATVTFRATVPAGTPAGAVPRLYGDTYRMGMLPFFEGTAVDVTRSIEMTHVSGNTWTADVRLGNGTCVRYLYTLGDYRINHERDGSGTAVVRTYCVNGDATVVNTVSAWKAPGQVPVSLTASSPPGTTDTVFVTTDGWGGYEPLRMWTSDRVTWSYTLYTDPSTTVNYRYVRNGDPAIGIEKLSPDDNAGFRTVNSGAAGAASVDTIARWRHQLHETLTLPVSTAMTGTVVSRATGSFQTGVEFIDYWRSSWMPLMTSSVERVKGRNARWAQIASVWGMTSLDPPIIDQGWNSFSTEELVAHIRAARAQGMQVALRAFPYPLSSAEEAGFGRSNSAAWYDAFFAEVKAAVMHHAVIAQQEGVEMLILSNHNWVDTTGGTQLIRQQINTKWQEIIAAVRALYPSVQITTDYYVDHADYDWYGDLDYLGDKWWVQLTSSPTATIGDLYAAALSELTTKYLPISQRFGNKPFVFPEVAYYSAETSAQQTYGVYAPEISDFDPETSINSAWDEQALAYEAVLWAMAETPWVQGCYSFGYAYFDFDSRGYSIRGKTAEEVMSQIYQQLNAL